jgi:NTP pyrophosphatase (non-canonical NTP hydrolase)
MKDYAIGSSHVPGLSKVTEEVGEAQEALSEFVLARHLGRVGQVAGKIIGLGAMDEHWDGTNLKTRMEDELADLIAAVRFFTDKNGLDNKRMVRRLKAKLALFNKWHKEMPPPP